jgi:hypothetical protein
MQSGVYGLLEPQQTDRLLQASLTGRAPATWAAFFLHGHVLMFAAPAGLALCFRRLSPLVSGSVRLHTARVVT